MSNITELVDGIAKCPYNPAASVTGFLSDSYDYFFGGTADFSSSDTVISKYIHSAPPLRTEQYNSFWLNDPQFVGSFETSKFAYFLFRETAVEYINCGKVIYSRIARVCKNDKGRSTKSMSSNYWTTFIKARLNCSVSGEYPFYYNEIQSAQYIPEQNVVYATFTTPGNSIAGSAVCAFNLTAVDEAFNGPFKYQPEMDRAWTSRENEGYKKHLSCAPSEQSYVIESTKYQLMDNAVQATSLNPLYTVELERFSHLTIDVVASRQHQYINVIYVATEEGLIKKLTLYPHSKKACLVEIWQTSTNPIHSIKNMQFLKETNSLYATTENGVVSIPANHCRRHSSKESCLNAMDPYCGWNEMLDSCTTASHGDQNSWIQSLNSCPILDTAIDGGIFILLLNSDVKW